MNGQRLLELNPQRTVIRALADALKHRQRMENRMIDLGKDPNGDPWDLDLRNSGSGWTGTFANIIRRTVEDILDDGPWQSAEVTLSDGTVFSGVLDVWTSHNNFTITEPDELPRVIDVDDVVRFRA